MRKCNKLLKVSSIFYLLYAIAVIMYSKGLGGFLLTIGIFLLTYSFLDAEHLQNKKVIITIIFNSCPNKVYNIDKIIRL